VSVVLSKLLPGKATAHTLRHRFASEAYASCLDLRAVQELLGHADPKTTARYTAVPAGQLIAAVRGIQ
jgi:site-specific recombinase XerD